MARDDIRKVITIFRYSDDKFYKQTENGHTFVENIWDATHFEAVDEMPKKIGNTPVVNIRFGVAILYKDGTDTLISI